MNLLRFALLLFIPVTLTVACKPEVIQCPGNTVMVENQCSCELPYYGIDCEKMDSCIAPNLIEYKNCNGFDCEKNICRCEGYMTGTHCTEYAPDRIIGIYKIVQLDIEDDEYACDENPLDTFAILPEAYEKTNDRFRYPISRDARKEPSMTTSGSANSNHSIKPQPHIAFYLSSEHYQLPQIVHFSFASVFKNDSIYGEGRLYQCLTRGGDHNHTCETKASMIAIKIGDSL